MITSVPEAEEISEALRDGLVKLLPPADLAQVALDEIDSSTPLLSLPIDSVVLMALMNDIEDRFKVYIPEEEAFSFTVVGEIADYVRGRLGDKARRRENS